MERSTDNLNRRNGRRLRRLRAVAGWGALVVGSLIAALAVWSYGRQGTVTADGRRCVVTVSCTSGVVQFSLERGRIDNYINGLGWALGVEPYDGPWRMSTSHGAVLAEWRWWGWAWSSFAQKDGSVRFAAAPMWVGVVAMVGGGCWLLLPWWRARRRLRQGRCAACGYDMTGLGEGAVCPECGKGERQT